MTIMTEMPEIDAPSWSMRPEQPIDLDQIHELHRLAFRGPAEAELVDAVRSGPDFLPDLSLVAVTEDGSILGHVLVSRIQLEVDADAGAREDILALAPLAVLPPHWGRGIGSALVTRVLAAADQHEAACSLVLGSASFFGRFGFFPALEAGIHGPYDAAGDAFQVRPRGGSGPIRPGVAVYPAAFADV
jgi:putative acetyltransferase